MRRPILYAGLIAAPVLVLVFAAGGEWSTTRGLVGAVVALTVIPWLAIALAARSFGGGRDDGLVAFICGIVVVVCAPLFTIGGGWYRGRLIAATAILVVSVAWYVYLMVFFADWQ